MRATLFLFAFSLLFSVTSWALDIVELAVPGEDAEQGSFQAQPQVETSSAYQKAFTSYKSKPESTDTAAAPLEEMKSGSSFDLDLEKMNLSDGDTKSSRSPASIPDGGLSSISAKDRKELVMGTISKNYSQLKTCYKQGLSKSNHMEGKVVVGWSMDAKGRVADAEVKSSELNNKKVEECITTRVTNWQFPAQAVRGADDRMSYTFSFSADE